tara:strand:+ start:875 stop:1339 length:465 start_codon:yes stop_codon:yes gene_type:complete
MAHYAKLDENNNIVSVHSVDDITETVDGVTNEANGVAYLKKVHGWEKFKKTSYNTRGGSYRNHDGSLASDQTKMLRYNYAGVGSTYNEAADAFIPAKPVDDEGNICHSWVLNTTNYTWKAPIDAPSSQTEGVDDFYSWNEESQSWDKEVVYRAP